MSLCGMKSENGPNYITYHHNWFDHSDSRHPRIRTMTVHVYNNYFDGNSKYGVGVTYGASAFVEGNYFRNANDPMMSSKQGTDARGSGTFSGEKGGVIKSWNNLYTGNKNWAGNGGTTDPNGRKINFITNKYDYTNGVALGAYKEWYEIVGTDNGDGSWTIYDSKVSDTEDTIATNSLIAIEDAAKKGAYYQISKEKSGFYIDVPANVTKVIVKAKCGSSKKSGTSKMLSVNGQTFDIDLAADYAEYEAAVNVSEASTIEIANADKNCSMNVKEIKVIASTGWETKLTSGADLSNIDAYEVSSRSEQVPSNVTARSGGTTYSNFDVALGDSGMGVTIAPTDPTPAKDAVLKYSGRHESDYAFQFTNSVDDESYSLNDTMNTELENYKTGMTAVQGANASTPSGNTGDNGGTESGNTGTGESGSTEGGETGGTETPATPATPTDGSAASLKFDGNSALNAVSAGTTFTVTGTAMDFYPSTGKVRVLKVQAASSCGIKFTTPGTTSDKYSMVIAYFNAKADASELEVKATGAESGSKIAISGSAGKQGSKSDLTGTTVNASAVELTGGTEYTITRSGSKEFGLVSITLTKID